MLQSLNLMLSSDCSQIGTGSSNSSRSAKQSSIFGILRRDERDSRECGARGTSRRLIKEALRELGLPEEVSEIEVCDSAQAEALAFPGSPTIRVDDKDVETSLPGQGSYGLSCRTYVIDGKRQGVPSQEVIRKAIRPALALADREK
jgi:hypothetical protein